jgi:hypothetical protein
MTASGPADPFQTKPSFFKRLFGASKGASTEGLASSPTPSPSEPASASPDEVTVEGRSVEDVLAQLHALGITEIDEATLRGSIGDKHPNVIKVIVERERKIVRRSSSTRTVADEAAVLATGERVNATITSVSEVDPAAGTSASLLIGLSIHRAGEQDTAVIVQADPSANLRHLLFPGATLPVRIDPADPQRLGVDWANAEGTAG